MEKEFILALITAPSMESGDMIAKTLLEKKLVACVNLVTPVMSLFSWQGEIDRDEEVLLIIKSRADLFESDLIPAVEAVHPYDVPEIIAQPIMMGSAKYLNWITLRK
jgi:periplasmic divalent cation tolerance protein